ncbi:Ig-like domain-containing protein [Amycolatopsis sp. NPDC051716]|jgi:lipoprotein-anchoring transpeptidase ErfK/SrfK|uniref:L,D-transpeptidase n=1 Tax=Amycolatopsis sp. NPDC051716 TaxID=3155804 RepID=UPI003413E34C
MGVTVRISTRRRGAAVALGLVAVLTLGACSSEPTVSASGTSGGGPTSSPAPTAQPAKLTVTPAGGAQDVAPGEPVVVQVADGTITSVTLTNPDGKQVQGQASADKKSWTTTEQLGYGKTYTWSGQAQGADGKNVPIGGAFTTVKPKRQLSASLNVGDGQTYGIAMPIALSFPSRVTDKASVEKALSVETTPKTEGSWAWLDGDTTVHWRPKEYYKPNTQVKVNAKIYGVKIGDGVYGKQDVSASFAIGRSQIVKGNTTQHTMQVIRDGQQIADYPVSYGLDSDPGRVTHSGVHVVMGKQATYAMSNPKYHYENVVVPWAVRISNNGEFIHGLAASVWAQGKKNVSHGCLNLSPARAKEYYDGVLPGDPVEITGSTQTLSAKDGDYSDWTYDWASWQKLSALAH